MTAAVSIAAGEQVRWLPRRRGVDLCLPLNDYWVFDGRLVRFHYFSGTGEIVEDELADDPSPDHEPGRTGHGAVRSTSGREDP